MKAVAAVAVLMLFTNVARAAEPLTFNLLPGDPPPGAVEGEKVTERSKTAVPNRSITNVRWPTVTVYLPAKDKATGAAVVICPGGGYGSLAIDKEGHDVARWLNSIGVAGVVLKYRLPRPAEHPDALPFPQADARRAIRLVRSKAGDWNLDPKMVGIMGFSAGGHLAATTATTWEEAKPDAADPLERCSTRPDFAVLVYPVVTLVNPAAIHGGSKANLLGKDADAKRAEQFSAELQVTPRTPPTFLVHARDDGVKIANSELYLAACKKDGVPAELYAIEKAGHGFGLGINGGDAAKWPAKCAEWLAKAIIAP